MEFKDFLKTSFETASKKYNEIENKSYEDYEKYIRIYSSMSLEKLKKEKMYNSASLLSSPGRYKALLEAIEAKE